MDYNFSTDNLIKRGKYLTDVIDKQSDKASKDDLDTVLNNESSNLVVTWGPSAGKTTAIRQFIVNNYNKSTGIVATKLIEDVDSLYYDIISQIVYKNNINDVDFIKSIIVNFNSNNKDQINVRKLQNSLWIICTHERLLIEPPAILFVKDPMTKVISSNSAKKYQNNFLRNYLFIDEYPSTVYKSCKIKDLLSVKVIDTELGQVNLNDLDMMRTAYIQSKFDNPTSNPYIIGLLDGLPSPTNNSKNVYSTDLKYGTNTNKAEFDSMRMSFYTNFFLEKLNEYNKTEDYSSDYLYYTINDIPINKSVIFDGTGDILFKDSSKWTVINNPKFSRKIKFSHPIKLLKTKVKRSDSADTIGLEYSNFINKILQENPNERILVYTWKDSKDDNNDLLESINKNLSDSDKNRLTFIHYMSGKERVTSEYKDCSVLVVLGKFFIPNYEIDRINNISSTNISTEDYTLSLIIQCLYRTCIRDSKPIRMYITNDYNESFINKLTDYIGSDNKIDDNCIESNIVDVKYTDPKLLKKIVTYKLNTPYKDCDYLIIDSTSLYKLLFGDKKSDHQNRDISRLLNRNGINYDYNKGSLTKGDKSYYKITVNN